MCPKADLFLHTFGPIGIRWLNRDRIAKDLSWLVLEVEKAMNNLWKSYLYVKDFFLTD